MKRTYQILLLLLITLLSTPLVFGKDKPQTVKPEIVGLSSERLTRLDDRMNRHVAEKKIADLVRNFQYNKILALI